MNDFSLEDKQIMKGNSKFMNVNNHDDIYVGLYLSVCGQCRAGTDRK